MAWDRQRQKQKKEQGWIDKARRADDGGVGHTDERHRSTRGSIEGEPEGERGKKTEEKCGLGAGWRKQKERPARRNNNR